MVGFFISVIHRGSQTKNIYEEETEDFGRAFSEESNSKRDWRMQQNLNKKIDQLLL